MPGIETTLVMASHSPFELRLCRQVLRMADASWSRKRRQKGRPLKTVSKAFLSTCRTAKPEHPSGTRHRVRRPPPHRMVVSAQSALSIFSSAIQFLNGRATHSMERIAAQ
jgi:hypothetical protein